MIRRNGILCRMDGAGALRKEAAPAGSATHPSHLRIWRAELEAELRGNILPFYMQRAVDLERGGFHGLIHNDLRIDPDAPRGVIQVTRILWAFAHACRMLDAPRLLGTAERARDALQQHFTDTQCGGLYWMVAPDGTQLDPRRFTYAQAFGVYALAEYALATGSRRAFDDALALFGLVEQHLWDEAGGGYVEGRDAQWQPDPTLRVDSVAGPVAWSMNTHLHIVEAWTTLLRAVDVAQGERELVASALRRALLIVLDRVIQPSGHFGLQFDAAWRPLDERISYGHDIEGSWLIVEAAEQLGDAALTARAEAAALRLAHLTLAKGVDADGGLFNEGGPGGPTELENDWWPQAEAMVGFLNAFQLSGEEPFLLAAERSWRFIQTKIVDRTHGEWFWGIGRDGRPVDKQKSGPWKGPYHNGRACLETMRRLDGIG
jgi:mannobiose 2-epimerase